MNTSLFFAPCSLFAIQYVSPVTDQLLLDLRESFIAHVGEGGEMALARAPGRVNLIGEHIDYNGLPVFPMAIQRAVRIAFRDRDDDNIRIRSVDRRYPTGAFRLQESIPANPRGEWINYVKAAAQALCEVSPGLRGLDAVVSGDIPVAAGLSSSSALVVAVATALIHVNELAVESTDLMRLLARGERYVGTQGGGMDQAISIGAREGNAAVISFDPMGLEHVPVPLDWRFVVASSLIPAKKSGPAQEAYNLRTVECRRALALVADHLGEPAVRASYRGLIDKYSRDVLEAAARMELDDVLEQRFRHVIREGDRVRQAVDAMRTGKIDLFGKLMNASHASLRDDYEVSSPELDALVEIARKHGAVGSRLTGAGFGGCVVSLCTEDVAAEVMDGLRRDFYGERLNSPEPDHLFEVSAAAGASVTRLDP